MSADRIQSLPCPPKLCYGSLDAWRGFAALWVVLVHAALKPHVLQDVPAMQSNPVYAFSLFGFLGVPMFFVISGICVTNAAVDCLDRPGGTWRFLKARVRRIYPPYLMATLAVAILSVIARWLMDHGHLPSSSVASLDLGHQSFKFYFSTLTLTQISLRQTPIVEVCWTLCFEVAFYGIVMLALFAARLGGLRARHLLNALHVLTIASLIALICRPRHGVFPLALWPQFGLGVMAYDVLVHPRQWRPIVFAALGAIVALTFASLYNLGSTLDKVGTRGQFIGCVTFAAALVLLHKWDAWLMSRRAVRAAAFFGLFSYSLYLTHELVQGVLLQLIKRSRPLDGDSFGYAFWLQVILPIPFALGFFWLFERPFISRRRPAGSGSPPPPPPPPPPSIREERRKHSPPAPRVAVQEPAIAVATVLSSS